MAYLITKLTLEEVLQISETMYNAAMKRTMEKINDANELEAVQKYRDYQYSLLAFLKQLKKNETSR